MKSISKFILFNILGWKVPIDFPSHIDKYIIIAAPHTSNWDFPMAVLSKYAKGKDIRFIGKHTLFKPPFGFIVKALGGTPVNRTESSNMVQSIIDIFNEKDKIGRASCRERV